MILANIYLNKFDAVARTIAGVQYYGRYVDDILLVVRKSLASDETNQKILEDLLVKPGVFRKAGALYAFVGYRSLYVQPEKIKIIYLDHTESRALIDIYNNTIRVIPSQMDPLPSSQLELSNFDEVAYSIENFEKENKIRDIGFLGVDSFNVGRYFSTLPRRYAHINTFGGDIRKEIDRQIAQIEKFFTGSQTIEYYSNWLNYMYFLVITRRHQQLRKFVSLAKKQIQSLRHSSLNNAIYNHVISLNRKAKDTLLVHLDICLEIALSLDVDIAQKHFNAHFPSVENYICSNMFDHSFVAFPLANYLDYTHYVSFNKMKLSDLGKYPEDITKAFMFIWSPRFIHYDELLLLLFYHFHANNKRGIRFNYPCLQVLLRLLHEAVYQSSGAVGRVCGRQALAGDPQAGKIRRQGGVFLLGDGSLPTAGKEIRAHPRFAGTTPSHRDQHQYLHQVRSHSAGSGSDQAVSQRPCVLVHQHAGRGVPERDGPRRQHRAEA